MSVLLFLRICSSLILCTSLLSPFTRISEPIRLMKSVKLILLLVCSSIESWSSRMFFKFEFFYDPSSWQLNTSLRVFDIFCQVLTFIMCLHMMPRRRRWMSNALFRSIAPEGLITGASNWRSITAADSMINDSSSVNSCLKSFYDSEVLERSLFFLDIESKSVKSPTTVATNQRSVRPLRALNSWLETEP